MTINSLSAPPLLNRSYEVVAPDRLKVHPRNVNQGDLGAIHTSLEVNGFYGAVIAQKSTGYIIAGNHRYVAACESGVSAIPVIWIDVDDDRALRIMLADNRTTRLGNDNPQALADLLAELSSTSQQFEGTGFDDDDLDKLIAALEMTSKSDNASDELEDKSQTSKSAYGVLVICDDEAEQLRIFNELGDAGYKVKTASS